MTVWPRVRMDDKPRPPPKSVRGSPTSLGCSSKGTPVPTGVDLRLSRGQSLDVGIPPSRSSSHSSSRRRLTRHASKERSTPPDEPRRSSRVSVSSGPRITSPSITSDETNKSQLSVYLSPIHDVSPIVSEPKVSLKKWKDIDGDAGSLSCSASHQASLYGGRKDEEGSRVTTAPRTPQTTSNAVSVRTSLAEICISHSLSRSNVSARNQPVEVATRQDCHRRCKNVYGEDSSFSCTQSYLPKSTLSELTRSVFINGRDPHQTLPPLSNIVVEDTGQTLVNASPEPYLQTPPNPTVIMPDEDTDPSNPLSGLTASFHSDVPVPFTSGVDVCLSRGEPDRNYSSLGVSATTMKEDRQDKQSFEAAGDTPLDTSSDSCIAVRWAESELEEKMQRHVSGDMAPLDIGEEADNQMAEGGSDNDIAVFIAMQAPVSEPTVHVFDVATGRSDCNDSDFMTGDEGGEEDDVGEEDDDKNKPKEARSDNAGESDYATADEEEVNTPPLDNGDYIAPEPLKVDVHGASENQVDEGKPSGALNEARLEEESKHLGQPFKNECIKMLGESFKIQRTEIREDLGVAEIREDSRVALRESQPGAIMATAVELCGICYTEEMDESIIDDDPHTTLKLDTQVSGSSRVELNVTESPNYMSLEEAHELPVGDTIHPTNTSYIANECLRDETISGVRTYEHTPPLSRTREYPPCDDVVQISVPSEGILLPPGFLESHPGDVPQLRPVSRLGSRPDSLSVPGDMDLSSPPPEVHPEYALALSGPHRSESQLTHEAQKPQQTSSTPKLKQRFTSFGDLPSVTSEESESPRDLSRDVMRRHRSQILLQVVDGEPPLSQFTAEPQPAHSAQSEESIQSLELKNLVESKLTSDMATGSEFPMLLPQDLWSINPQTSLLRQEDQIVPSHYVPQYATIPETSSGHYNSRLSQNEPTWATRASPYDQAQSRPRLSISQLDAERYEDGTFRIPRPSDQYGLTELRCSSRSRRVYDVIPETDMEPAFHPGRIPRVPVYCTCEEPVQALPTLCLQSFPAARTAFHLCPDAAVLPTAAFKRCSNCGQDCNPESLCKALGAEGMPRDRRKALLARAIATCQEELGPLNETLSLLHQKIRALDLPEFSSLAKRQSGAILPRHRSSDALMSNHPRIRSSTSLGDVGKPHTCMCVATARGSAGAPIGTTCPNCGLRLVPEPALSPLARMYILLAQPKMPPPPTGSAEREDRDGSTQL